MANLIYINNHYDAAHFEQLLGRKFNSEFKNLNIVSREVWYESHYQTDRTGNPMLWDIKLLDGHKIPTVDTGFNLTYADVTDLRALEIERLHETTGLPIVICWSGGIDSTCIVAAAVKNFTPRTRANTVIALDNCSYFENPYFFNNVIVGNFRYNDLNEYSSDMWQNSIVITGEPADPIWLQADVLEILHRYPGGIRYNLHSRPGELIEFIASKTNNISHAEWFYQYIINNASAAGRTLETYEDFYWWTNFNFYYTGNCIKMYLYGLANGKGYAHHGAASFNAYLTNYQPWYASELYQQWSIANTSNGVKITDTIQSYKEPAKKYIFDVDNNPYYYHYKTKTGSGGYASINNNRQRTTYDAMQIFAAYDDGSTVKFKDLDAVKQLLLDNPKLF